MTDKTPLDEGQLQQLYQRDKQQHTPPASIKANLMRSARNQTKNQPTNNGFSMLVGIGVAATLCITFSIMMINNASITEQSQAQIVYYHDIQNSKNNARELAQAVRIKYDANYQNYLAKQQSRALHHQQIASITATDDGWWLITCDEQRINITNELMVMLNPEAKDPLLTHALKKGQWVEIGFNKQGQIIQLKKAYARC